MHKDDTVTAMAVTSLVLALTLGVCMQVLPALPLSKLVQCLQLLLR